MDISTIRSELKTRSIYEIPMRVTYYARVSSDTNEQVNSLINQVSYYEELIRKVDAWTFVDGYVDEGISGISVKKRENFNRMISDAEHGKFDFVLTKEISRFARNTLDSITYTRQLLSNGVGVFFQNDNISTLDEDSELRLSIMSSIAQDELRKLSSRIKFGHEQALKNHVVYGNSRIVGYKKDNKRLVIDEEQAPIVKELFELYSTGKYSMKQIENIFWDKGYRNLNGNKISHATMKNVIKNPKYKGYYVGNKVKIVDMFTKKQKFLPEDQWIMFKDETGEIVPAIVPEELWNAANVVLEKRSNDVKERRGICNHDNLFTGKIFCAKCGSPFYRKATKDRTGAKNSNWVCSGKVKNGVSFCDTPTVYEKEIVPILLDAFANTKDRAASFVDEYISMFEEVEYSSDNEKSLNEESKKIELAIAKKDKLLEFNIAGRISDDDFIYMTDKCNADIEKSKKIIDGINSSKKTEEEVINEIDGLRKLLVKAENDVAKGIITREFVEKYIEKIFVSKDDDGSICFDINLSIGDSIRKSLSLAEMSSRRRDAVLKSSGENFDSCTGHTLLNVYPVRTYKFTRNKRSVYGHSVPVKYIANLIIS